MDGLPVGGISDPVVTRFGVHLIQVIERREVDARPQAAARAGAQHPARAASSTTAYNEWLRDLRGRAYVELREPPQ